MLASLVPMFRRDMTVAAYCLFAQKENLFENPHLLGTGSYDGVGSIVGIDVINNASIDNLSNNAIIIVPVNNISIFADISSQLTGKKDNILLLLDSSVRPESSYINRLKQLKADGFLLAMKKIQANQIEEYKNMLSIFDYIVVNCNYADPLKQAMIYKRLLPNVKLVAENVNTNEVFDSLKDSGQFEMFEGDFYRIPINKADSEVSPLKVNYLKILSVINKPDFDLTKVADIISQDPALSIALLNTVNKMTVNNNISSIKQATALLGQKELKTWLNSSALSKLCTDKPNEITRLSLVRAKFAENLAPQFGLGMKTEELFLMGLFSLLDIILDKPMEKALSSISVSNEISRALVSGEGEFSKIYEFMLAYEAGNWQEVSRQMLLNRMDMNAVYQGYLGALKWYKDMF